MRFSFGPSEIPQWKREQFPNVKFDEYTYLKESLNNTDQVGYQLFVKRESIKYDSKLVSDVNVVPVSSEFIDIQGLEFEQGRFYNESESNSGTAVIVLGYEIAQGLFGETNALGKNIRLYGQRFTVIGVLKKQGAGVFGDSNDTSVFLPVNFLRRLYGDNNDSMTPVILIKPKKGVDMDAYKAEITYKLRSIRGVKAGEIDNFFINVLSGFTDLIDGIIGQMNVVGWIISGFSLLVGGFGIANIMFVILTKVLDFEFVLSMGNIMLGTGLAALIGLISGILPAITASKLDPVEAIRTGM